MLNFNKLLGKEGPPQKLLAYFYISLMSRIKIYFIYAGYIHLFIILLYIPNRAQQTNK